MDTIRASDEIAEFISVIKERYAPTDVILFGSRARGDHRSYSDYDFIVVSDRFRGVNWHDRRVQLLRLWQRFDDVDIIPYTPEEFADKSLNSSIIRSAIREGKRIDLT